MVLSHAIVRAHNLRDSTQSATLLVLPRSRHSPHIKQYLPHSPYTQRNYCATCRRSARLSSPHTSNTPGAHHKPHAALSG